MLTVTCDWGLKLWFQPKTDPIALKKKLERDEKKLNSSVRIDVISKNDQSLPDVWNESSSEMATLYVMCGKQVIEKWWTLTIVTWVCLPLVCMFTQR